ncbi:hypothetical protein [Pseudomonas japonica]|uniref:hypothetical protein n=1 Tax=Pseudomonas japonica TaxID=256466 RepID=UPI0015E30663|nr:hypothetical protein [Pseudomonas japonica]MBA1290556.1 hypothetical protein [Pseudomonas japonica]
MPSVYDEHERLLSLIHEQKWDVVNAEDNALLKALVQEGYITATLVPTSKDSKTRVGLTVKGMQYLTELCEQSKQVQDRFLFHGRRSTDAPH